MTSRTKTALVESVFLEANVLFSAAYRTDAGLRHLWELKGVDLVTSAFAAEEARRNLSTLEQKKDLEGLLRKMEIVKESSELIPWVRRLLPQNDAQILTAAIGAKADVLISGDLKNFGPLMHRTDLPLRICTVRAYLEGKLNV